MLDKKRFDAAFNYLATATRLPVADITPETKRVYYDGMQDLPAEDIESAAAQIAKSAQWFPKVAEWRAKATQSKKLAEIKQLGPAKRENDWRHECDYCEDGGWSAADGRTFHEVVVSGWTPRPRMQHCVCRATNHTYQRKWRAQFGERAAS